MTDADLLLARLTEAGLAGARSAVPATGGVVASAGLVTLSDGSQVFAKTLTSPSASIFQVEAEGLQALRELGDAVTPTVLRVAPNLLVLEPMRPRRDDGRFWERLGRMVAGLHTGAVGPRFGWHHDGWLGRMRQDNTWEEDGHSFYARRRILRWLTEPLVAAAFDTEERRALERLCEHLPELVPAQPPALTHGDLWSGNILTDQDGGPVLVDPAVSYNWPEVDLAMLWCSPRPPTSQRFFDAYAEVAGLAGSWWDRMEILNLREVLSVIAHGDDDWGAAAHVRRIIAPFRRNPPEPHPGG